MAIAVLLAGGIGKRVGRDVAKQHIIIRDHQIIEYTLTAFSRSKNIESVVVVSNPDYISEIENMKLHFPKLTLIVPGGETRIQSVKNGVFALGRTCTDSDKIIISDAARPCITTREINEIVELLSIYKAVTTGIECYETVISTENNIIQQIIDRRGLIRQTSPEGYQFSVLRWLYLNADEDIISSYKNIGIDQLYGSGLEIGIVKSNPLNFKITTDEDVRIFDSVIKHGFNRIIDEK